MSRLREGERGGVSTAQGRREKEATMGMREKGRLSFRMADDHAKEKIER